MLVNELTTTSSLAAQATLYLPHLIFFLYKIGQSVFSPTTKLYLYASVCSDRYGDHPFQLVTNGHASTGLSVTQHAITGIPMTSSMATSLLLSTPHSPRQQVAAPGRSWHYSPQNFTAPTVAVPAVLAASPVSALMRRIANDKPTAQPHNVTTSCQELTGLEEDVIQMEAADYIMAMKILQDVPAFMLGLFCGSWSDRVGRRLPMMLPCIGGLIVTLLFVTIQASGGIAVPGILFGVAVNSFTGRNTLVSMAVQAYVTDQSTEEERTRQLGRILAMNFFGLFAGSFIMAVLADRVPFWVVFLCVSVFYASTLALICFALPESKVPGQGGYSTKQHRMSMSGNSQQQRQEEFSHSSGKSYDEMPFFRKLFSCFQWNNFTDTMSTIVRKRPNNLRRYLICAYLCIILHNMCKSGEIDVLLLFVKHTPLNWTKSGYGYLLSFQYATVGLLLIFALPFLLNTLKLSDSSIIVGCVIAKAFGLSLLAFSEQGWMVFVSNVFVSTFGMIISCLRSIVTKMVDEDETGRCFAIITSSETVSDLIGVVFFTRLYYVGLSYPHGRPLPFVVMALIHIILLALALYINHGIKQMSGEGALNAGGYDMLNDTGSECGGEPLTTRLSISNHRPPSNDRLVADQNNHLLRASSCGDDDIPASLSNHLVKTLSKESLRASVSNKQRSIDAGVGGGYGAFQQIETRPPTGWSPDNNSSNNFQQMSTNRGRNNSYY